MANGEGSSPGGGYDYREPFLEEPSAYYVKRVRALFLAAGLIMVLSVPILGEQIFVSKGADIFLFVSFFWIVLFGVIGALGRRMMIVDIIVSAAALVFFEFAAVLNYSRLQSTTSIIFLASQTLAVIFFLALFFSVQTYRAYLKEQSGE